MTRKIKCLMVLVVALCSLVFSVCLWNQNFPAKAQALEPLIKALADFKARTGSYPTNALALPAAQSISHKYSMYWGERTETKLTWNAGAVSSHDLTVLVESNYFTLFAPTGRIAPISFSSFPVWRYESTDAQWNIGRIHCSLLGTYWSED